MEEFTEADVAQHPELQVVDESKTYLSGSSDQLPKAFRKNIEDAMNMMI